MKKSPNKAKGGSSRREQERCFVPIHQDHVLESLAIGIVRLDGRRPAPIDSIGEADLSSDSHGFAYGLVGLLELSTEGDQVDRWTRDGYALLSDCKALWLRSKEELDELEGLIPSFGDTVSSALVIGVDGSLFQRSATAGVPRELFGGDPAATDSEEGQAAGKGAEASGALVERLAGAVSLLRRRVLERGMPLGSLGEMLSTDGATAVENGSPVHHLVDGVMRVAKPGGAPDEDARILAVLAEKLVSMDFSEGIVPDEVLSEIHRSVASTESGGQLLAAIESLQATMRKVAGNQLALSGSKIDDSGQVGLRGIMVFLLAPSPTFLSRWLAARPEVGNGVAMVASLLVGLFAGHGRIPVAEKGPGKDAFLSSVRIAADLADRGASFSVSTSWNDDGSRSERIEVGGAEFAAVVEPAREEVRRFIQAAQQAGAQPRVDPASGTLTVQGSMDEKKFLIRAEIGKSKWRVASASEVAVLQASVSLPGRGPFPKAVLEDLLSPSMPPVWATLAGTARAMTLSIEVSHGETEEMRSAIARLTDAIRALELVPEVVGEKESKKRTRRGRLAADSGPADPS